MHTKKNYINIIFSSLSISLLINLIYTVIKNILGCMNNDLAFYLYLDFLHFLYFLYNVSASLASIILSRLIHLIINKKIGEK